MIQWFRYAINGIIVTVLALLLVVFVLPRAAGYKPYVVVSASMQQSFPVGSLIYVRDAVPEEIAVGDPITFASGSLVITHRVIDIDSEQRIFTTKGDSNNIPEQTPFDALRGKAMNFCLPGVGYFATWFSEPMGKLIVMINLLSMVILSMAFSQLQELWQEKEVAESPKPDTPDVEEPIVRNRKEGETVGQEKKTQRVFRPAEIRHPARGNARFHPRRKERQ